MVKKLLLKVFTFWALILTSALGWGQCPTSVSISASPGNTICAGTPVTFTANPNGGTAPFTYQWKINGINEGAASTVNTFTSNSLSNGQKISVTVTDGNGISCSISSSDITMTVNTNKTPTVSLSSSPSLKCIGEVVTFTATNTNGGTSPQYAWYVNSETNPSQSSSLNTFSISTLSAGTNNVRVVLTSSLDCVISDIAEATANITITENASISAPTNKDQSELCLNEAIDPITFNIGGSGNGATVSGLPPGVTGYYSAGNFTISGSPTSAGSYPYTVTATGSCKSVTASGTLEIVKDATISLNSGSNSQDVCQGEAIESITYDIGESGTGASVTGLPSGISGSFSSGIYTISGTSSITGTHTYSIHATGTCGNSESLTGSITINQKLDPSVNITSSDTDNNICEGTEVVFKATPVHGGSTPSYQWQINGSDAGSNSSTFTTDALANGDVVTVIMSSSENCLTQPTATSNSITTTVSPNLTPTVSIVELSDSFICEGDEITFTASPINGGTSPSYQWMVNGASVGTDSPTFTTTSLANGQSVTVTLTSNETCLSTSTATSEPVSVTVNPNLTPEVSITSNDPNNILCSGSSITFTASPINGGSNPSYQWFVNNSPIGSNSESFTTNTLNDGDIVRVLLTSNEECLATSTAESNEILVQVDSNLSSLTPVFDNTNSTYNPTAVCPVVSGLIYKVQEIPEATSYKWTFPSGWNITSGNGTNMVTVTATSSAQAGNIRVTAINECGSSKELISENVSTGTVVYVSAGPDQTVCKGTTAITLAGEIGGVITKNQDWDWSASVTGGSFSNNGNSLNGTYTLPSTIANNGGTVTVKITSIDPAGACGPKEDEMTITVLKNATISTPTNLNQTACINTSIEEISFSITDAGTGANVSGLPAGLIGSYDSGIFKISGTPAEAGSFPYTVSTSGSCANQQTSIRGTVTVTPDQTINDPANKTQEICIDTAIEDIVFTTNESVTNVVVSGLPTGLTGTFSSGSYTISGTATQSGNFEYTVTTSGNCVSASQTGTITVNPNPTIDIPTNRDQEVCINTSLTDIRFNITSPATDAFVEGLPDGVSGTYSNGVFTLSGTPTVAGTFDYTVTTISDCADASQNGKIIVTPDPTAQIAYGGDFCDSQEGTIGVTLTGTGAYTGGNFSSTPEGLVIDPGTGDITPGSSTPNTYTVSYNTTSGCKTFTAETTVKINPLPSVEISYTGPFCTSDDTGYSVNYTNGIGAYEGGTFSSTPGTLDLDPNTGVIKPKSSDPDTYKVTYTIPATLGCSEVVVETNVTITKLPQVVITYDTPLCNSEEPVAVSYSSTFGDYSGGTFSATAGLIINAEGTIDPQASTPGIHTVTYTKDTEGDGCDVIEATTQVEIFEKVQITTQPVNFGTCSSNPASFEVVATGDNLQYQWYKKDAGGTFVQINGETNAILSYNNATSANAGEYHVVVSSSNAVCTSETSDPVTLNIDEDIIITKPVEDQTICEDDYETLSFEYEAHANGAELSFQWIKDGSPINELADKYQMTRSGPDADGVYTGTLTILNIDLSDDGIYAVEIDGPEHFTCSEATSKSFTFRVNKRPEKPVTAAVEYCLNASPVALTATKTSENNELLWYSYDAATDIYTYLGTSITPSTSAVGTTSYWVTQKQPNTCESDPQELVVTVYDKPEPVATETIEFKFCFQETVSDPISITPDDGSTLNWYDAVDATTALGSAPIPKTGEVKLTSYWVSQTLTSTGCESDRTKVDIIINELPNINIGVVEGYSAEICLNTSTKLIATGATNYTWYSGENVIGETSEISILGENAGTFEYKVVGTDANGCVNENVISIKVEEPSEGGTVSGPSSVCETQNEGTLAVSDFKGEIQRWESSTDGTNWTAIAQTSDTLDFQNISGTTTFRAIVKNGVCAEVPSTEISVSVDPVPVGGELAFDGHGRTIETCSNPGPDYNIPLSLTGQAGDIVRWRYKEGSATEWSTVMEGGENFTGTTLSPALIRSLGINQSTIFEVEITSGACTPNAISQNATLGIVSSDIAPNPVTVTPGVVCLGEEVTLSGSTGYGTGPGMEAGAFDYSSITNKGWRIKDKNGVESNFDSSADNGVAAIWLRTNPLPLTTAHLTSPYSTYTYSNWDSSAGDEGNKGFAVVSGPNPSTLETSVFNLFAVDNPVLTFDQAYNLTPGSAIYVDISTDGGENYNPVPLFELIATDADDGTSGNYDSFGDDDANAENKISLDLTDYANLPNLRIRFRYEGTRPGDVWAVDAISLPVEPTNVDLTWRDYTDPANPVLIGTDNSEQWAPKLVGWNDFEIRTRLTFDSTGQQCPVVENWKTISVFVFDQYTSTATAVSGSCGSNNVQLNGEIVNSTSTLVTEFPTRDDYSARWEVVTGPTGYTFSEAHFTNGDSTTPAVNDPHAVFSPGMFGSYTLRWALNRSADDDLTNETCPPIYTDVTIDINDCTALDFDGFDDYVDLGSNYQGNTFFEAWIRPFNRPLPDGSANTDASTGTIISGPGFEISMGDLPATIIPGTRWYHIAVSNTGELWVDGIPSDAITVNGHGGNRTIIGARWNSSAKTTENHFSGWIEEVRIWNKSLTVEQIRFMMNQRLIANGAKMGEQIPMDVPDGLTYSDLAGYYRLISADPEPLDVSPVVYLAEDMPANGLTPDRATTKVPGRLMNMETNQENTAPLPYYSGNNGVWGTDATWLRPDVWDPPHTGPIEWNIARTSHDITSGSRDILLLGLISEVNTLDMEGQNPNSWTTGGTGNQLYLSHYLLLDGIIDLNGESQLVQPTGSIVDVNSSGHLDRDQQGTASSYNYNYWSSPVGPGASNAAYTVKSVMLDGSDPDNPQGLDFGDPYAYADGGPSNPKKVSTYWLHKFHGTANNYFEWEWIGDDEVSLEAGEGYSMKGTIGSAAISAAQNYTFRGLPNNGDVIPGTTGPQQNYLIGNPYPSAIDANLFIADNLGSGKNVFNGTIYFWSHFAEQTHYLEEYVGGYAAYNISGGVMAISVDDRIDNSNPNRSGGEVPQQYIPVGQAFFINTMIDENLASTLQNAGLPTEIEGGNVLFQNSQRAFIPENNSKGGSVFNSQEKKDYATGTTNSSASQGVEQNKIWLKFKSPKGYHRQILVTADQRATENFDLGFDAPLIEDNVEDMYWYFNNYQFVIQGVPDFNLERVLDLGIKVDQKGSLSISIDDLENISDEMNIYLADSLLQVVHDLRVEPYETESEAGIFTDRFKLVFQDKTQVVEPEDPVVIEEGPFEILYVTGTRNVLLRNPELIQVDRVYLNNMLGQQVHVYYDVPLEREVELPVSRFSAGVYIVKVHSDKGIFTKKVILE